MFSFPNHLSICFKSQIIWVKLDNFSSILASWTNKYDYNYPYSLEINWHLAKTEHLSDTMLQSWKSKGTHLTDLKKAKVLINLIRNYSTTSPGLNWRIAFGKAGTITYYCNHHNRLNFSDTLYSPTSKNLKIDLAFYLFMAWLVVFCSKVDS